MGFIPPCGALDDCTNFSCKLGKCKSLVNEPCRANTARSLGSFSVDHPTKPVREISQEKSPQKSAAQFVIRGLHSKGRHA